MIIINGQGDCTSDIKGTGLGDCVKQYGDLTGIDLYKKSWKLNVATDSLPTEAEYKTLIQNKDVFPLNNLYNFEQATPDNEFATGSTGLKSEIRAGKPEYSLMWDKGGCFHEYLYDKRGKNRWNIAFKFESGVLFCTNVDQTELKAFDNGMFSVSTFKFLQGTDPEMSTATFQFNTALEINERKSFYTWDSLGYDMNQVNGVIPVDASFNTTPTASTDLEVKVVDACNGSVEILGLELADFTLAGTQASATTISAVSYNSLGYYDVTLDTPLVSTDTVQIVIAESGSESAESTSGDLYSGKTSIVTIA